MLEKTIYYFPGTIIIGNVGGGKRFMYIGTVQFSNSESCSSSFVENVAFFLCSEREWLHTMLLSWGFKLNFKNSFTCPVTSWVVLLSPHLSMCKNVILWLMCVFFVLTALFLVLLCISYVSLSLWLVSTCLMPTVPRKRKFLRKDPWLLLLRGQQAGIIWELTGKSD